MPHSAKDLILRAKKLHKELDTLRDTFFQQSKEEPGDYEILKTIDKIGEECFGVDNFEDYFSGVSVDKALAMLFDEGKISQKHLLKYVKLLSNYAQNLIQKLNESKTAPKKNFMNKVVSVLSEDTSFNQKRGKILSEVMGYDINMYQDVRFTNNEQELKEAIEALTKTKIVLREKKNLKEADETAEYADPAQLFSDLSAANSSLGDALASIYAYKNQYIENPTIAAALAEIRKSISESIKKLSSTMVMIGSGK